MKLRGSTLSGRLFVLACAAILFAQLWLCLFQIGSYWQWGHNGYNGAAYEVAARNSLRHGILWPAQYHTAATKPKSDEIYTHAPLALHWLTTLSVAAFGDHEASVRLVPSVFSLLMTLMLLIVLAKHFSRPVALVAGVIFVFLPINTIYCNMTNHSTGCIFFALMMFDGYLEWSRSGRRVFLIELAAGAAGAAFFDWPGFTLAMCLTAAAFYEGMKPGPAGRSVWTPQLRLSMALGLMTILAFQALLNWISSVRGITDVMSTITERSGTTNVIQVIRELYGTVIDAMFPRLTRILAFAWALAVIVSHARRAFRREHIVPVSFFVAGMVQFLVFPNAAAMHHYWNWQFTPFVAIACGEVLVRVADIGGRRLALALDPGWRRPLVRALAWCLVLGAFGSIYLPVAGNTFRQGRAVAGSFDIPGYDREYRKILFAKFVHDATRPGDGVAIHTSLAHRIEFESYLDRLWISVTDDQLKDIGSHLESGHGWVLIGDMGRIKKRLLATLVKVHPIVQVDGYFLVDLRKTQIDAKVYLHQPLIPRWGWRMFVSAFDPPVKLVRVTAVEARLVEMFRKLPPERPQAAKKITGKAGSPPKDAAASPETPSSAPPQDSYR